MIAAAFFIIILGLIIGSFLSSVSFRLPKGENFVTARSRCVHCSAKISFYDNIPLLSYLLLSGRCRNCKKKISLRYPFIELATAFTLLTGFLAIFGCEGTHFLGQSVGPICYWKEFLSNWVFVYYFLLSTLLMLVFIIDAEKQIILDEIVFFLFILTLFLIMFLKPEALYTSLFTGFFAGSILLILNIVTLGRGMGLGDVKLALALGLTLGSLKMAIIWLFLSFLIGALVGLILVLGKRAKFGKQIAFGPFLVIAFFITLFWGETLFRLLFPVF